MKKIFFFLFLLSYYSNLFAQNYKINHFTVNQGLSQSVIYSIYQDSKGFIWVGTQDGLNRFDGYSFVKYLHTPSDTNSLPDSWVYSITEDQEGNLWIGTRRGLCKFNSTQNNFTRYSHNPENEYDLYKDNVYGCVIDSAGNVYTNTPPLINCFNKKTEKFVHYINSLGVNPNVEEKTLPIIIDKECIIWAASTFGLTRFDPKTKTFTNFQNNPKDKNSISNNSILSIYEDNNGLIWIGTPSGIDIYDKKLDKFYRIQLYSMAYLFGYDLL